MMETTICLTIKALWEMQRILTLARNGLECIEFRIADLCDDD